MQQSDNRRRPAHRSFSEGGTPDPPSPERFEGQAPDAGCRTRRDAGFSQSAIGNRKSEMLSTGQAMVEFMIGMVAVLVLLAGLIQIGQLMQAHTRTMRVARTAAGQLAMASNVPFSEMASPITDWDPGSDQRRHTHDDTPRVTSDAFTLPGALAEQAHLEWVPGAPSNALATLAVSSNSAATFFMVKGEASESVPIISVIRNLVYAHSSLEVESEVWLVWTGGIY